MVAAMHSNMQQSSERLWAEGLSSATGFSARLTPLSLFQTELKPTQTFY